MVDTFGYFTASSPDVSGARVESAGDLLVGSACLVNEGRLRLTVEPAQQRGDRAGVVAQMVTGAGHQAKLGVRAA